MGSSRSGTYRIPDGVVLYARDLYQRHNLTVPEIARRTGIKCLRTVKHLIYFERRPFPDPTAKPGPMPNHELQVQDIEQ